MSTAIFRKGTCTGLVVAYLTIHGLGFPLAHGQTADPIWSSGNTQIDFPRPSQPVLQVRPLPTPSNSGIPAPLQYAGNVALRSQHAQYDREGELLFFAVDGNIYNADGYLIADAGETPGDRDCRVCTFKGNEFHVVPVPGSCSRYYVISLFGASNDDGTEVLSTGLIATDQVRSRIRAGILDLTLPSDFPEYADEDCIIRGRFMTDAERGVENINLLADFDDPEPFGIEGDLVIGDPEWYLTEAALHNSSNGVGMVHAASTELENDGRVIMMARTRTKLIPMILTSEGITRLAGSDSQGTYPMIWFPNAGIEPLHNVQDNDQSFRGELAIRQVGNELRIAYSSYLDASPDQTFNENRITYWKFQLFAPGAEPILGFTVQPYTSQSPNPRQYALDQTLPNTLDPPLDHLGNPVARTSVSGLEFSPNGQYLYFTKSGRGYENTYLPNFGYIDVTVQCDPAPAICNAYFYPSTGDPAASRRLVETQLGMNWNEGLEPALYMIGADASGNYWLSTFTNPDDPDNGVYQSELLPLPSIAFRTPDGGNPQYRMLNHRVANSTHYQNITQELCCEDYVLIKDQSRTVDPITQAWTPGSNPFCNTNEPIHLADDLVFPPGAVVSITDLTFRFGPEARMVISPGATVTSIGCTFTSACERWPGIRVEGNTANTYQVNYPSTMPLAQRQGGLILQSNSMVENAWIGVWCAREMESHQPDPDHYGGWVRSRNSTFRNCVNGIRVQNYRRFEGQLIEQPNRTTMLDCDFEVNSAWPSFVPNWQVRLDNVRHVKITNCRFENSAPQLFQPDQTGGGVQLNGASAYIDGDGNPNNSYFRGLQFGVMNAAGILAPVRVSRMHFENNRIGIADLGSSFVEYGENTFVVRDQGAAPNPRVGMLLWETKQFTIEQNTFAGEAGDQSVGIFCVGYTAPETEQEAAQEPAWSYTDERIYNNTFTDLQAGTLLTGLMRGHAWGNQDAGLQIFCGDYTNNRFDIAVLPRTMIRPNQGGEDQLAGNRFYNVADCSSNYDWALDVDWNQIPGIYPMELDYKRHEFPDDEVGVTCDQWPDFDDISETGSGLFIKVQHCSGGVYPVDALQRPTREASYLQAKNLLYAALATYNGTVDLGETPDLKQAIHQNNPWLSSSYLRDLLLAKHPLSDEVLVWLLKREVPMDPWHLTQVLLQNSKLNSGVWSYIKDNNLLSPFFYAMVEQAQQGTGITTKQALEQEIAQRRLEMTEQINVLGHIYARDTTGIPVDSLKNLMSHDPDHQFLQKKVELLLAEKRYAEAAALLNGPMAQHNGREVMADLLALQQSTNGVWKELSAADKDLLWAHAEEGKAGAARAAAILLSIDEEAPLPPIRFPNFTKSRGVDRRSAPAHAEMEPVLACFPNPAKDNSFLAYPAELDGTFVTIHDAKGALVHSLTLSGNGLMEINVHYLDVGLYNITVPGTNLSTKLNVQR